MYSLPGMRRRLVIFSVTMLVLQMVAYMLAGGIGLGFWGALALSVVVIATVLPFYATMTAAKIRQDHHIDLDA